MGRLEQTFALELAKPEVPVALEPLTPVDALTPVEAPKTPLVFGQLVRDYSRYVLGLLRRLGVAPADLEDVAQEVFLAIHAQLGAFEARSTLKTWVCGVCRNKACDYGRRAGRRRRLMAASPPPADAACSNPQEELLRKEREALLQRELAKLSHEQREVFVLFEIEELSMKEVAEAVGCPLDTAYTRHRVARQRVLAAFQRVAKAQGGE